MGTFSFAITAAGIIIVFFWKWDDAISKEARSSLSRLFLGLQLSGTDHGWPIIVQRFFDKLFGVEWFSFRRVLVTSGLSALSYWIVVVAEYIIRASPHSGALIALRAGEFFIYGITINFIADYASAIQTRYIIGKMLAEPSAMNITKYIVIDFFLTCLLAICAIAIFVSIAQKAEFFGINHLVLGLVHTIASPCEITAYLYSLSPIGEYSFVESYSVVFATTFLTSIWIWVTALTVAIARLYSQLPTVLSFAQYLLPFKTHPLRAMGEVMGILFFISCLILWLAGFEFTLPVIQQDSSCQ